jgi:hypothetical protein
LFDIISVDQVGAVGTDKTHGFGCEEITQYSCGEKLCSIGEVYVGVIAAGTVERFLRLKEKVPSVVLREPEAGIGLYFP